MLVFSRIQPCCLSLPFHHLPDEVQAIATLIEKQAQIVVKPRMVSEEEKQRKAALLAQYADVTDEEEYPFWSPVTCSLSLKPKAFAGCSELCKAANPPLYCSLIFSSQVSVIYGPSWV